MKSENFNPENIALASMTRYAKWQPGELVSIADTDKVRGDLALQLISQVSGEGYRVVLADSGSSDYFLEAASRFENVSLVTGLPTLRGEQRRSAFRKAASLPNIEVIINTEFEKVGVVQYIPLMVRPIFEGANIVVPSRRLDLFKESYPHYMQASETIMNTILNNILHGSKLLPEDQNFDWFFGPRVIRNDAETLGWFLEEFKPVDRANLPPGPKVEPDLSGSNPQFYGVYKGLWMANLAPDQYRVADVTVPFEYPSTQRDNELIDDLLQDHLERRSRQIYQFSTDLVEYVKFQQGSPDCRIARVA